MKISYWLWSLLAFLGCVFSIYELYNLKQISTNSVQLAPFPETPNTELVTAEFSKPFDSRQEVDAILAIDFSGSMCCDSEDGTRAATDPNELRLKAAELMVGSLASDVFPRTTRMGYIAFGETVETISPLQSVEDVEIRKEIVELLDTPKVSSYTNIIDALYRTEEMLFPNGKPTSKNIPALVLLTDGHPTGGVRENTEIGIKKQAQTLLDKGMIIFVIILRNPEGEEIQALTDWRNIWKETADKNIRFNYIEAQKADELESIYNKIRARLVNEGTKLGERKTYDPTNANESIDMPPNLLQAHLLVGKAQSVTDIELLNPDKQTFTQLAQDDPHNELLISDLYYRYRIHRPQAGKWKLTTTSPEPIYYLLNPESLFSARIAWQNGTPYLTADETTQMPIVVVDENGVPSTKQFELEISVLRTVNDKETGAIVEQTFMLPKPTIDTLEDGTILYYTKVSPDYLGERTTTIQIGGEADDGTLVNLSLTSLPSMRPPSGVSLKTEYEEQCINETVQWYPFSIQCGNMVTVTLIVTEANRLQPGSLQGEVIMPDNSKITMKAINATTLQQVVGPLSSAGTYRLKATVEGELEPTLIWQERTPLTAISISWPNWLDAWQNQLWIAAILLLICAIWKPVIIALLLPVFHLLKIAPSGYYAHKSDVKYPYNIYEDAWKRGKLFTLTIGDNYNNSNHDILVEHKDCFDEPGMDSNLFKKMFYRLAKLLKFNKCSRLQGRLVTVPFKGIWVETKDGFNPIGDKHPSRIGFVENPLYFCKSDWTDKNR